MINTITNIGKFFKWCKLLFLINFKVYIRFFTLWGIILQTLFYLGFLKKFQESMLYIVLLVSIGGFVIVYINPKYILIPYFNIKIKGRLLRIADVIFHHLPLILFLWLYDSSIKADNLYFLFIVLIFYIILINPFMTYRFKCIKNMGFKNKK